MRVVIADDEVLLREGLARLLAEVGVEVTALVGDRASLVRAVALDHPDVAIVDIKMPPTYTNEGLVAAADIKRRDPRVGVLLLSHYLDSRYAVGLLEQHASGVGYLLSLMFMYSWMRCSGWPTANPSSTRPSSAAC
jgi:DNA-binding NarL/FixJ family response regulator